MGTYVRDPRGFGWREYFPIGVKWLLIVNVAIFVFFFLLVRLIPEAARELLGLFGLRASSFLRGALWQPLTYQFLHDPGGFWHILFNMLSLWMFGADLEREWGTRRFLNYYLVCGAGAGLCDVAANLAFGSPGNSTIGASGAIYGVLLAFGLVYPRRTVYFSFLFPIQARYFVLIMGLIAFLSSFDQGSKVSNIAHLGGMLFGYLYLRYKVRGLDVGDMVAWFRQWRRRRMQRKFQVYMRKHDQPRDRDRWVN